MTSSKRGDRALCSHEELREVRRALALLNKEVRTAQRFLEGVEGRRMSTLLPLLILLLKREEERCSNEKFGGYIGRFTVAKEFTEARIPMDFRFAERLLAYAVKKKKACLVFESTQESDDLYGSDAVYKKIHGKK
jgi:hypothetical protein